MSKIKVAILISGFVRNWDETYKSLLNNLIEYNSENYQFDIFCLTYDRTTRYSKERSEIEQVSDEEFEKLKRLIKPVSLKILNHEKWNEHFTEEKKYYFDRILNYTGFQYKLGGIIMQTHAMAQSFELMEQHATPYDIVMKTRFDIFYSEPCRMPHFDIHDILMCSGHSNQNFVDAVLIGRYDSMKVCMNSHSRLEDAHFMKRRRVRFTEDLIRDNIRDANLSIGLLDWHCELTRERGPIFPRGKKRLYR